MFKAIIDDLRWQSDWNGYEVGWEDIEVIGLYTNDELMCDFYIDVLDHKVVQIMPHEELIEEYL